MWNVKLSPINVFVALALFLSGIMQLNVNLFSNGSIPLSSNSSLNWTPFHNLSTSCTNWTSLSSNNFTTTLTNSVFNIDGTKAQGTYWAEAAGYETTQQFDSTKSISLNMMGSVKGTGSGWAMELRLADNLHAISIASVYDAPTGRSFVDIRPVSGRYIYPLDVGGCGSGTIIANGVDLGQPHIYNMSYSERVVGSDIVASVTANFDNNAPVKIDLPWRLSNPNIILAATSRASGDTVQTIVTSLVTGTPPVNVLVDDSTQGYFNSAIGLTLAGTQPQFPPPNTVGAGEPNLNPATEPDLTPAQSILGPWISSNPLPLNSNWTGIQNIPKSWAVNTSVAIIYELDAGQTGISNIIGSFGVDNGMYIWINGSYIFGATQPGHINGFEYANIPLGGLHPGKNYIEIILEDHGQVNGFTLKLWGPTYLDVPQFYQGDPSTPSYVAPIESVTWSGHPYGNKNDPLPGTIGDWGCNTTSNAMIINYYARESKLSFRTDPDQLNTYLRENDGYRLVYNEKTKSYDSIVVLQHQELPKTSVEDYASSIHLSINPGSNDDKDIINSINSGNPVLLQVNHNHWLVAIGVTTVDGQPTYIINDPIWGQTLFSSHYTGLPTAAVYYNLKTKGTNKSHISIGAFSPIHLVVTDPQGRKEGYDPQNDISWDQIPKAAYIVDRITDPDGNSMPETKLLYIPDPVPGSYTIEAIGYDSGSYEIDIDTLHPNGVLSSEIRTGIAYVASVDTINITYVPYSLFFPIISK